MASRLLLIPEVAERLRKTDQGVRWMFHTGKGPKSAVVGGRRVVRESDLESWIEEQFEKASA